MLELANKFHSHSLSSILDDFHARIQTCRYFIKGIPNYVGKEEEGISRTSSSGECE